MKLSTRGRYAARLMLDLALHRDDGFVHLKDLAARQEISQKYLGQLVPPLKKAGLISANRGAHGGYRLAKPPGDIRLGEIVWAVEGDLSVVECVTSPEVCDRIAFCVTRDIWGLLRQRIVETLDSITLEDMVDRHWKKQDGLAPMWHI
jgi:Rrf2 family protein